MTATIKLCPVENDLRHCGGLADSCATCPNRHLAPCVWIWDEVKGAWQSGCNIHAVDKGAFCSNCGHPIESKAKVDAPDSLTKYLELSDDEKIELMKAKGKVDDVKLRETCGNCKQYGAHHGQPHKSCWYGLAVRDVDPSCQRYEAAKTPAPVANLTPCIGCVEHTSNGCLRGNNELVASCCDRTPAPIDVRDSRRKHLDELDSEPTPAKPAVEPWLKLTYVNESSVRNAIEQLQRAIDELRKERAGK